MFIPNPSRNKTYKNKHGVPCVTGHSGKCFGRYEGEGKNRRFVTNVSFSIPVICLTCNHYDDGEYGEFGVLLAGPICEKNIWWPVRKGVCKARESTMTIEETYEMYGGGE